MTDWEPIFTEQRGPLFAIAYRMLGSVAEAEDVLQEAWLRVQKVRVGESATPGEPEQAIAREPVALLKTVVVRLCLDQLKSARRAREAYVGPWLPEPLRQEPADGSRADERMGEIESVSMAFLLVLEALSPLERAAFLLREVFDYEFAEIARLLDRSEVSCRQLCHRAREHVAARRSRFHASREQQQRLMQAFVAALTSGDAAAMAGLLRADAVVSSDGGGEVRAALKTVQGRDRSTRLLLGLARRGAAGVSITPDWLNGCAALLLWSEGVLVGALLLESEGNDPQDLTQVSAVRVVVAPSKLRHLMSPTARKP